jgi:hypothetical protein
LLLLKKFFLSDLNPLVESPRPVTDVEKFLESFVIKLNLQSDDEVHLLCHFVDFNLDVSNFIV